VMLVLLFPRKAEGAADPGARPGRG
jgi:hypothetical protein